MPEPANNPPARAAPTPDATADAQIRVEDIPETKRYELRVGAELGGYARYRRRPGQIFFMHTEISDAFEGRGLGSTLIRFALADARSRHLEVVPLCPFVRGYIERHPEHLDLVPPERRSKLGLSDA